MSSLSPDGRPVQECFEVRATPRPAGEVVEILPFDAAGWADGDYDPPAGPSGGVAAGRAVASLPVRLVGAEDTRFTRFVYSLNVVLLKADAEYPDNGGGYPDYEADAEQMLEFDYLADAQKACDRYAAAPEDLPLITIPAVTHVVVYDWEGRRRYERRIRVSPVAA
jgi:hypothetical protein